MSELARAMRLIVPALALALMPPPLVTPTEWARAHLVVPDGPRKAERWSDALTPYIREPLDALSLMDSVNEIAVMKSAQTGFTTLLIAAFGHNVCVEPSDMMIVQPTDSALTEFNSAKLQHAIDFTKDLKDRVAPQTSRSGTASTTYEKKFGNASCMLALASSAADLRSKTRQKIFCDEVDEYLPDLDGQGDPLDMIEARQESFLRSGVWKRAYVSTPTIAGASNIERLYNKSDKRLWHVTCPHCSTPEAPSKFVFDFGPHFVFSRVGDPKPHYVAPCCGAIIEEAQARRMSQAGEWIATVSGARIRGYHFNALNSPFVPWSVIARRAIDAEGDEKKAQTFANLTLGRPYEARGDAPDHQRLLDRRERHLVRGHVPADGLLLIAAADVQARGVWYTITAYTEDRRRYLIDANYLDGDTGNPNAAVWGHLARATLDRIFPLVGGGTRRLDALAIDSGFHTASVYAVAARLQRPHWATGMETVYAVKGRESWGTAPIGTATPVTVDLAGKRLRRGAKVWPVGTWPLKAAFYADLRKGRDGAAEGTWPEGYIHLGDWVDEPIVLQLTAEYLADEVVRGRQTRVWKLVAGRKDNHLLDCMVYSDAIAEHFGLSTMTPGEWAAVRARLVPDERRDLFTSARAIPASPRPDAPPSADPAPDRTPAESEPAAPPVEREAAALPAPKQTARPASSWLGDRATNWTR